MAQAPGVGFLVFARREYPEPLRYLGRWTGESPTLEDVARAWGGDWLEVVLVPEDRVRWVIRAQEKEETHA